MALTIYIYSLSCPETGYIKYIGKAENPELRLRKHIEESLRGKKTKKCNWIKSLINKNLKPVLNIEDCVPESDWIFWERYYISLYKSFGFNLKNDTIGGEGGKMSKETIEKIRKGNKNKIQSEYQKEKMRLLMKGNKNAIGCKSRSKNIVSYNVLSGGSIYFNSIKQASEILNIGRTTINNNLVGMNKIVSKRFKFKYLC